MTQDIEEVITGIGDEIYHSKKSGRGFGCVDVLVIAITTFP
jgi:hypothetical protein